MNPQQRYSLVALLFSYVFLVLVGFVYYPKWKLGGTEAAISWDASGYYMYLPALLIYQDIKGCAFQEDILREYSPTPDFQQAFIHEGSGNHVMKYSSGIAVLYSPFFGLAHAYASISETYPADGFSRPYQLGVTLGSMFYAFLGLFFLRKVLLRYVSDRSTAMTLVIIVLGTNYLEYSAISGLMTHNALFTLYAILLWQTIYFYEKPSWWRAASIGLLVGLAALTRPTDILSALIPLLWGLKLTSWAAIQERIQFVLQHVPKYLLAVGLCLAVGSIQLIYWKYASGDWIVYSYQDQGFYWTRPYIIQGMFSYKAGWLVYTPMMVFALIGLVPLFRRQQTIWYGIFLFSLAFAYVTFAWEIWWYGGSLGQRGMVQAYPVLAIPLAVLIEQLWQTKWVKYVVWSFLLLFTYYNLWLTHQAHWGRLLHPGNMTKGYFWKILGEYEQPPHSLKLLDTKEEYTGERENIRLLASFDFEGDSTVHTCADAPPISGNASLCMTGAYQYSPLYEVALKPGEADWVRATATFRCIRKEWENWRMTQFILRFYQGEEIVLFRYIRLHRTMDTGDVQEQFIDVSCPKDGFDRVAVFFWNADSPQPIQVDDLRIEAYDEPR